MPETWQPTTLQKKPLVFYSQPCLTTPKIPLILVPSFACLGPEDAGIRQGRGGYDKNVSLGLRASARGQGCVPLDVGWGVVAVGMLHFGAEDRSGMLLSLVRRISIAQHLVLPT